MLSAKFKDRAKRALSPVVLLSAFALAGCGGGYSGYTGHLTPQASIPNMAHTHTQPLAGSPLANAQPTVETIIAQSVQGGIPNIERVAYTGAEVPGTIIINTYTRSLYLIENTSTALYYPIAVGRGQGMALTESCYEVARKAEWPTWTPTPSMHANYPGRYPTVVPGGPENPMGAAALYMVRCSNGQDDYLRIHGTNQPDSIGRAASSGCIRLNNAHISDLFNRATTGSIIRVHNAQQTPGLYHQGTRHLMGYAHG